MSTISIGGARYFLLWKDDAFMVIYFLKEKTEALNRRNGKRGEGYATKIKTGLGGDFVNKDL